MNFTWHSLKTVQCADVIWMQSKTVPGVSFAVRRVSLGERIALAAKVRESLHKHDFLIAGESVDRLDAGLTGLLVKAAYVEWGLKQVKGLKLNGKKASVTDAVRDGPEALVDEILAAIKAELGLTEEERKNF